MRAVLVLSCSLLLGGSASTPAEAQSSGLPGHLLDVRVGEYFILAPDSIPAGLVTLRLTQTGDVTKPWPADMEKLRTDVTYHFHMIWLVRLDSGKTITDVFNAERARIPTPWMTILGGPGFADTPGSSNVTMMVSQGSYALICFVGSAQEDRNRYHLLKGMIRPLKVTGVPTSDTMPAPQLTVVLGNDSASIADSLTAGVYRILVRNEGPRSTDFAIGRLKSGYTVAQARAWRPRLMTEPPRHAIGGIVGIPAGRALMTTVVLEPGDYFVGDEHVVVRR